MTDAGNCLGKGALSERIRAGLSALLLTAALAGPAGMRADTEVVPVVTQAAHAERVAALKALLDACIANSAACQSADVGADERMQLDGKAVTLIRLDWLRAGISRLGASSGSERQTLAADLSARLKRLGGDSAGVDQARLQQARAQLSQILAATEFAAEPEPNWLQRKWMKFKLWLYRRWISSFAAISETPAWVRLLLEAFLFLVPVVLLLAWLLRQVREDRLHPFAASGPRSASGSAPGADWLAMGEELARQSRWREAIHALYWATIVSLESRKLFAVNRTRTPREYIRLLPPGSPVRAALAEQTRLFELTWYGQQEATEKAFTRASQLRAAAEAR